MPRPRSDIAPRILRAARDRFLELGVDGAGLREIARDAGTSIGMVYYYFPSKDDLFLAVVEDSYAGLLADVAAALDGDDPFPARVDRLYGRFARMTDDEVAVLRIVMRELLSSAERRNKLVARFLRGRIPVVLGAVAAGAQRGEIAVAHHPMAVAIALMLAGLLPQLVRRLAGGKAPAGLPLPPPDELAHALASVIMRGVSPR
jgi:AcrR family transcriptional regulator